MTSTEVPPTRSKAASRASLVDGRYLDERRGPEIVFARTPDEAVARAMSLARTIEAGGAAAADPAGGAGPQVG